MNLEIPTRCLTIKQRPLSYILSGEKTIENRSFKPTCLPLRLALHRGRGVDPTGIVAVATVAQVLTPEDAEDRYPDQSHYICHEMAYCWILSELTVVPWPIWAKGRLGIWPLSSCLQRTIHDLMKQGGKAMV